MSIQNPMVRRNDPEFNELAQLVWATAERSSWLVSRARALEAQVKRERRFAFGSLAIAAVMTSAAVCGWLEVMFYGGCK